MDWDSLSYVKFGDKDSLGVFLFENGIQHQRFRDIFHAEGIQVPAYPITDAATENLDDWLLAHQDEHQSFANLLQLDNPFNMLDVDWNVEDDFYDWVASHYYIHEQIAAALSIT